MKKDYRSYPSLSLYDYFKPGDRVKRKFRDDEGRMEEYEGIIMNMDGEHLEIYWDTIDGSYCPDLIEDDFTSCPVDEVMNGTEEFSPIKQKRFRYMDLW